MRELLCSFCNKKESESDLVGNKIGRVFICSDCVNNAHMVIHNREIGGEEFYVEGAQVKDTEPINESKFQFKLMPPHEVKEKLDEYVIGQDQAKKYYP